MIIDTVLFDMGGTIEDIHFDRSLRLGALPEILAVLGGEGVHLPGSPESILDTLLARNAEYKAWSEKARVESPATSIWKDWNLRDFRVPPDTIAAIAERLAFLWETRFFRREMRPDAIETLEALKERGYRLGVISNTSSRTQVFSTLEGYGIGRYFECVVLSSIEGIRKPHPGIFQAALRAMGSGAEKSAYVGDTLSRDVIGSKLAGFALAFKIESFLTSASDSAVAADCTRPDFLVSSLGDIVAILDSIAENGGSA
jgi:putative hydrolase of the HAD superfamily